MVRLITETWARLARLKKTSTDFLRRDIWRSSALHLGGIKGRLYALLRVLSIILDGLTNNRLLNRSAALSCYSLLGLAPLVAIIVMVSGFVLHRGDPDVAANGLNRILRFIAPPVAELARLQEGTLQETPSPAGAEPGVPEPPSIPSGNLNEDLVALIEHIIDSARSGTVGVVGALLLIFIGIQLLTSIEGAFNEIWGVRRGRSWYQRIVFYWSLISLGAILGSASITLLSTSAHSPLLDILPFGDQVSRLLSVAGPLLSFFMILLLLYGFYRLMPNTRVGRKAALVGAFFVTIFLFLNNYLSFLYVQRVITQQSLYGSLGILPILMIGLYIFWFFVLIGGQITYSVQNAGSLTHQYAWNNVSGHAQGIVSLAAFALICRRFRECQVPYSSSELTRRTRVPGHILNECLNRLADLGFINTTSTIREDGVASVRYQPARPLDTITLGAFRSALESYGNNEGAELIQEADPIVGHYLRGLESLANSRFGAETFEEILAKSTSGA